MADLADIRAGLAANLAILADLQVSPYMLSNPTPPAAEIVPSAITYDGAFARSSDQWQMTVRVFVGAASDQGSQIRLDRMMASEGTDSVKTALEFDCTLGAAVSDLHVKTCSGYREYGTTNPVLGCEWDVIVYGF